MHLRFANWCQWWVPSAASDASDVARVARGLSLVTQSTIKGIQVPELCGGVRSVTGWFTGSTWTRVCQWWVPSALTVFKFSTAIPLNCAGLLPVAGLCAHLTSAYLRFAYWCWHRPSLRSMYACALACMCGWVGGWAGVWGRGGGGGGAGGACGGIG